MRNFRRVNAIHVIIILQVAKFSYGQPASSTDLITVPSSNTQFTSMGVQPRGITEDHDVQPKSKPWLGYYDFLITEGSYKFWVVFELFTCALLVYSAFAALYYAKYTTPDYDYDDYYFKKRSSRSLQPTTQGTFLGLTPETYFRIFQAIQELSEKYST